MVLPLIFSTWCPVPLLDVYCHTIRDCRYLRITRSHAAVVIITHKNAQATAFSAASTLYVLSRLVWPRRLTNGSCANAGRRARTLHVAPQPCAVVVQPARAPPPYILHSAPPSLADVSHNILPTVLWPWDAVTFSTLLAVHCLASIGTLSTARALTERGCGAPRRIPGVWLPRACGCMSFAVALLYARVGRTHAVADGPIPAGYDTSKFYS